MYDVHPVLAAGAAYLLAASSSLALRTPAGVRVSVLTALGVAVASTPWLLAADERVARFFVSIYAGTLMLKMWDLHVGAGRSVYPSLGESFRFFANVPSLVHRNTGLERQPGLRENAFRLASSAVVAVLGVKALLFLVRWDWGTVPFLLEHAAKAGAFFVAASASFTALAAAVRLAGGYAPEPSLRPLAAKTPAEFWRRYNRWIGEGLREDVFRPFGGRRHPVRATLGVFLVSGMLHEYVFAAAVGQVQGFQLAFFMLQGIAVAVTLKARPSPVVGVGGTVAFNAVSSILFFASVHGVAPFYAHGLPAWLAGR